MDSLSLIHPKELRTYYTEARFIFAISENENIRHVQHNGCQREEVLHKLNKIVNKNNIKKERGRKKKGKTREKERQLETY